MKRESLVATYTVVGGILGAALAVTLPFWVVIWGDTEVHIPLWFAFEPPVYKPSPHFGDYIFPLSVAAILIIAGVLSGRKLGKRMATGMVRHGYCEACGYNLTGNWSGVCPECGTPIH